MTMMTYSSFHVHIVSLLLALTTIHTIHAVIYEGVRFTVAPVDEDTAGGKLFIEKMGVAYAEQYMMVASRAVSACVFKKKFDLHEKVHTVRLVIDREMDVSVSSSSRVYNYHAYEIHLNDNHIARCRDFVKQEIRMLLIYELAHALQSTASGKIPPPLKDGIAAFAVIRLSHKPTTWVDGEGDKWDQSPHVTAQFLYYCNEEYPKFVEQLNKMLRISYDQSYFVKLTSKTIGELWYDYKNKPPKRTSHSIQSCLIG